MAELGETTNPGDLVPGDTTALRAAAQSFGRYGDVLVRVGSGLNTIDDGGWSGPAADGFRQAFDGEPARWITCGDCFHSAKDAVVGYAGTLDWAQGEAAAAIDLWERGEQATRQARAQHTQAEQQAQQQAAAAGEPAPGPAPFNDPGEELREQARQRLGRARDQVASHGNSAAATVERAQQPAPEEPNWLEDLVGGIGDAIGDGVRAVGEAVGDVIQTAGGTIENVLDGAGNVVNGVLDVAGGVVGGVLEGVGEFTGLGAISDAGKTVGSALDGAGDAVDEGLDDAGDAVGDATDDAGDAVEDATDDAGDTVDPDEDDDGHDEGDDRDGDDSDGHDGDVPDDGPDDDQGSDDREPGAEWGNAEGDADQTPDPETIYTTPERQEHILDGDPNDPESGGHRHGTGKPNKTEFPERWDDDTVIDNVEDVARDPDRPPRQLPDGNWEVRGERDGVNVRVIVRPDGSIETAHPTSGDGVVQNDRNGNPHPKPFE